MGERLVRVRCSACGGAGNGFLPTGQWTNKCIACGGEATVLATLSDPEVEALIADGERWQRVMAKVPSGVTPNDAEHIMEFAVLLACKARESAPPEDGRGVGG